MELASFPGLIVWAGPSSDLGWLHDHVPELVDLAHSFIEQRRDDAAVAVTGRAGEALAQAKAADKAVALFVVAELQAHAFGIVPSAGEAIVFL